MSRHGWTFARIGGFEQVQIESGADLAALGELDQKLWAALACPTTGLELDARTLSLVDTDGDGRIHANELVTATRWATSVLEDPDDLLSGAEELSLDAIHGSSDEGKLLRRSARAVLRALGKPDATKVGISDVEKAAAAFAEQPFNGDGVVTKSSAPDGPVRRTVEEIVACTQPAIDKSGAPGLTRESSARFFAAVDARAAWIARGGAAAARPLGDRTAAAFAALETVRAKIDDFFARCRVAAFDPRALAAVNREESAYLSIAARDLDVSASEVSGFPIARISAARAMPLDQGVNPAWAAQVDALRTSVVAPLLGERSELREEEWRGVCARFDAHRAWRGEETGREVATLPDERVRELSEPGPRADLADLLAKEEAAAPDAAAIESVEKLVRYHRDLARLARNFVSFQDFYSRKWAAFQAGTLFVDQRSCELTIRVNDAAKHALMAPRSNAYLVYCDCRDGSGKTMSIVAAVTAGDVDHLMVGRNGLFYDRSGKDWAATITKIVENPISLRQAFWAPYKKAVRMIEEQIARRAAAAESAADARVEAGVTGGPAAASGTATGEASAQRRIDIGTLAAIGVAVGGITAALGAILTSFFGLGIWMPLGVVALVLAISGPSMAVAWLKLRTRNLGPLLDANGWAVNAQAKLNVPLGGSLTRMPVLPSGSRRELADPFAERRRPWRAYAAATVVVAMSVGWSLGHLDRWLPEPARSSHVLGRLAPDPAPRDPAPAATP